MLEHFRQQGFNMFRFVLFYGGHITHFHIVTSDSLGGGNITMSAPKSPVAQLSPWDWRFLFLRLCGHLVCYSRTIRRPWCRNLHFAFDLNIKSRLQSTKSHSLVYSNLCCNVDCCGLSNSALWHTVYIQLFMHHVLFVWLCIVY